jgi:hypothetical protein
LEKKKKDSDEERNKLAQWRQVQKKYVRDRVIRATKEGHKCRAITARPERQALESQKPEIQAREQDQDAMLKRNTRE